jgi:CheY-like chemotaxis protein
MPPPDSSPDKDAPASAIVLLVEDDARVRAIALAMLEKLGYSARSAGDGPSALAILAGHQRIDLLFTDYVLPRGLNGAELADRARQLRPGLRVLHTSGYTERRLTNDGRLSVQDAFIPKPYTLAGLDRAIRLRLSGRPGSRRLPTGAEARR